MRSQPTGSHSPASRSIATMCANSSRNLTLAGEDSPMPRLPAWRGCRSHLLGRSCTRRLPLGECVASWVVTRAKPGTEVKWRTT